MTYIRNGVEYLEPDELEVWHAVKALNAQNRTTNNSQIANRTGLSRTRVSKVTAYLKARGFLKDVSKGAAYHWRIGGKQLPDPAIPDGTPGPASLARMFPLGR
jgi:biotin operon repressor